MKGACILGIDPGNKGGIALLSPRDGILLEPMPLVDGKIDDEELTRLIRGHAPDIRVAYLEHVSAAPIQGRQQGTWSMFTFGRGFGLLQGILLGLGVPTILVRPQKWTAVMHFGAAGDDTKERSRDAFARIFPGVNALKTKRSYVPHEGMIEAALIAEYGRRMLKGER